MTLLDTQDKAQPRGRLRSMTHVVEVKRSNLGYEVIAAFDNETAATAYAQRCEKRNPWDFYRVSPLAD